LNYPVHRQKFGDRLILCVLLGIMMATVIYINILMFRFVLISLTKVTKLNFSMQYTIWWDIACIINLCWICIFL